MTPPSQDENGNAPDRGSWGEYRRLVMTKLEELQRDQEYVKENFVSKEYFDAMMKPIFRIVFGMVAVILGGFVLALWSMVQSGGLPL